MMHIHTLAALRAGETLRLGGAALIPLRWPPSFHRNWMKAVKTAFQGACERFWGQGAGKNTPNTRNAAERPFGGLRKRGTERGEGL